MKETGGYLARKARRSAYLSTASFSAAILGLLYPGPWSFPLLLIGATSSTFFVRRYRSYKRGLQGENAVTSVLSDLDDEYCLINDLTFPGTYGNIDHVVLGPNGVFLLETKNYQGRMTSERMISDPGRVVKINAMKIRRLIESSKGLERKQIWVDGIVVVANPSMQSREIDSTVPVIKIDELRDYIKNKKTPAPFSLEELKRIAEEILKTMNAERSRALMAK